MAFDTAVSALRYSPSSDLNHLSVSEVTVRKILVVVASLVIALTVVAGANASGTVGTSFPAGFPTISDASLGTPVLGFGAAGDVERTPVIFLHGNNDTPFPTACNHFGHIHDLAQYFADHGYAPSELWGLGYQGDQCDLIATPTNRSGVQHSTVANVPDLRAFVHAVLKYTGARRVDIVGHSLGVTLAREWMRGSRIPPGAPVRCDRRPEPRHRRLLPVAVQLLAAARARGFQPGQRDLPGVRIARNASAQPLEPR